MMRESLDVFLFVLIWLLVGLHHMDHVRIAELQQRIAILEGRR